MGCAVHPEENWQVPSSVPSYNLGLYAANMWSCLIDPDHAHVKLDADSRHDWLCLPWQNQVKSLLKEVQTLKDKLSQADKKLDSQTTSSKSTVDKLEQKVTSLATQLKVMHTLLCFAHTHVPFPWFWFILKCWHLLSLWLCTGLLYKSLLTTCMTADPLDKFVTWMPKISSSSRSGAYCFLEHIRHLTELKRGWSEAIASYQSVGWWPRQKFAV